MSNLTITIELPEELVERAKNVGVQLEGRTEEFVALLEAEVRKREAGQWLIEVADKLQGLPDEMKPSLEEIDEAIKAHRSEKTKA